MEAENLTSTESVDFFDLTDDSAPYFVDLTQDSDMEDTAVDALSMLKHTQREEKMPKDPAPRKKVTAPKARNWVFTLNNPPVDGPTMAFLLERFPDWRYHIFQKEKGEHKTEHFQGYIQFSKQKTMIWMKGRFEMYDMRPHLEIAEGTPEENVKYCTKAETKIEGPWEKGTMVGQVCDFCGIIQ